MDTSSRSDTELAKLAESLKDSLEICDRKWKLKTYKQCFLHSEAVRWMTKQQRGDEEAAVKMLENLRHAGYIQHVVDPHKPFKVGQTKTLYFCFLDDENSHIQQQQRAKTQKFLKQHEISQQMLQDAWKNSSDFQALQVKLHRMASSIEKLTETQMATQTKLEIVHQATISVIRAMVSTAFLLLVMVAYTLYAVVPSLHQTRGVMLGTSIVGSLLVCAFVVQGSHLFSVWLQLDTCVVQAAEGEEAIEDYDEMVPSKQPRGGGLGRRQSSIILKEPMLRSTSSQMALNRSKSDLSERIHQRRARDIPDPSEWPHRPVLVCNNTPVSSKIQVEPPIGNGPCPLGKPFKFSSELFEGQCVIRLRYVPNSDDPAGDEAYFSGRRRLFQTIIQGRFKQPLPVSDVLTGHEFVKPLQNLPHPWILKAATNLIGKLAPGANIRVVGENPTMLACMAATSQVVRGDEPGNEPDIATAGGGDDDIQEDCSLFGGKFGSGNVSAAGRKLHLASPQRASQYTFDTETVYTFDFYQSLLNVATYSLDLGVANIGMAPILNGQPIQCLCKTTDGRYLWSFQIWHENLLAFADEDGGEKEPSFSKNPKHKLM